MRRDMDQSEGLNWIYGQMMRVEEYWAKQLQEQQTGLNSVMAVNGFLLAFLAGPGLGVSNTIGKGWYLYPYFSALTLLCIALLVGLRIWAPRVRAIDLKEAPSSAESYWLDSKAIWDDYRERGDSGLSDILQKIAKTAGESQDWTQNIRRRLVSRRKFVRTQLILIGLATVALMTAIGGIAYKVIP
jgi:hypothetical protein